MAEVTEEVALPGVSKKDAPDALVTLVNYYYGGPNGAHNSSQEELLLRIH